MCDDWHLGTKSCTKTTLYWRSVVRTCAKVQSVLFTASITISFDCIFRKYPPLLLLTMQADGGGGYRLPCC